MKQIFYALIGLLFISCATTKTFETKDFTYQENGNNSVTIKSTEFVEAKYEPNTELILFDTFCMPFVIIGLTVRETGRVVIYSVANIPIGYVAGMLPGEASLWLPDIDKTKSEIEQLNIIFSESDYKRYEQYVRPLSKTTLSIRKLVEEINMRGECRIISETKFTIIYVDSIHDTVNRVSKKSSLVGEEIGSVSAKIISYPTYGLGWTYGWLSRK